MSKLKAYNKDIVSVFQLIGESENDITKSIAWVLHKCPIFLNLILREFFDQDIALDDVEIYYQRHEGKNGITDIEITDTKSFYLIIEAKRGWSLPGIDQLTKYSLIEKFKESDISRRAIVSMSECSDEYALLNLPLREINGIPIKHLSWKKIYELAERSRSGSNNEQKQLLRELCVFLGGIMTMQRKDTNWVYVVSLSNDHPAGANISWIDIVSKRKRYFHPVGNGWPKEPVNYIAFRYGRRLQSIHHVEDYTVSNNMHDEIAEMPDEIWDDNHFIYRLGPAIVPPKVVKTGKIFRNGRVWAMLDNLLTSDSISEARDVSKERVEKG